MSDAKIRFALGDVVLTSKLIDGTFPDYQRVIPTANDKKLRVDCKTFAARRRPRLHHLLRARRAGEARRWRTAR